MTFKNRQDMKRSEREKRIKNLPKTKKPKYNDLRDLRFDTRPISTYNKYSLDDE